MNQPAKLLSPLPRILLSIVILILGGFITTLTLFVIGVNHMNPRLPAWHGWASLIFNVLPLLGFVICTLIGLWRWTLRWLMLAITLLALCWAGMIGLNVLVNKLTPDSFTTLLILGWFITTLTLFVIGVGK